MSCIGDDTTFERAWPVAFRAGWSTEKTSKPWLVLIQMWACRLFELQWFCRLFVLLKVAANNKGVFTFTLFSKDKEMVNLCGPLQRVRVKWLCSLPATQLPQNPERSESHWVMYSDWAFFAFIRVQKRPDQAHTHPTLPRYWTNVKCRNSEKQKKIGRKGVWIPLWHSLDKERDFYSNTRTSYEDSIFFPGFRSLCDLSWKDSRSYFMFMTKIRFEIQTKVSERLEPEGRRCFYLRSWNTCPIYRSKIAGRHEWRHFKVAFCVHFFPLNIFVVTLTLVLVSLQRSKLHGSQTWVPHLFLSSSFWYLFQLSAQKYQRQLFPGREFLQNRWRMTRVRVMLDFADSWKERRMSFSDTVIQPD